MQQHYLSKAHLKGFSDGKNVWCLREGGTLFPASPYNIAKRRHLFTLPRNSGLPPMLLEDEFCRIESLVAPHLRALTIRSALLTPTEVNQLALFVAMTAARVPAEREYHNRKSIQLIGRAAAVMNASGACLSETGYFLEENTDLGMLAHRVDALMYYLERMHLTLAFTETPCLILGDMPVVLNYEADVAARREKAAVLGAMGSSYNPDEDLLAPKRLRQIGMALHGRCLAIFDAVPGPAVATVPDQGMVVASFNRKVAEASREIYGPSRRVVESLQRHLARLPR